MKASHHCLSFEHAGNSDRGSAGGKNNVTTRNDNRRLAFSLHQVVTREVLL
jgi:hypothetical protein